MCTRGGYVYTLRRPGEKALGEPKFQLAQIHYDASHSDNSSSDSFMLSELRFLSGKTFNDYILKETTEHLIDPRNHWVATALCSNTNIIDAAVEDHETEQQRRELKDKVQRMERCMSVLRSLQSRDAVRETVTQIPSEQPATTQNCSKGRASTGGQGKCAEVANLEPAMALMYLARSLR